VCGRSMQRGGRRSHLAWHLRQDARPCEPARLPSPVGTLAQIARTGAAFADPAPAGLGKVRRMHVRRLKAAGLAEWDGGRLRLTAKGAKALDGELLQ
jgi:hypothetical protein